MPRTKSKLLNFRVTQQDYERIRQRAEKAGFSLSGFLLTMALTGNIIVVPGLSETARELRMIGNNVNQLTRMCHEGSISCPELTHTTRQLEAIWQSLSSLTQRVG